ncbi:hypothetical protein E3U43_019728, partial [Larimichthys crocea]
MAFLLICAGWRNRTRPLLLFYLFCFVTLSKSVLMNDGADSNESHQEASTLLRSLNLPQHT